MKKLICVVLVLFIVGCGSESKNEKSSAVDTAKVKRDSAAVEKPPEGYKSAHQTQYEEFKKDSVKEQK